MNDIHAPGASGKLGMWLFIATETILFGGMFLLYSMYRMKNPEAFHSGSLELSRFFGTLNTCILITSSFTVAMAIHSLHNSKKRQTIIYLMATIGFAFGFLIVKSFEWTEKFHHGLYPGAKVLMSKAHGEILYFGLYYMMTGLHAVHVIVGICVLSFMLVWVVRGKLSAERPVYLQNSGLYWHLVDLIWIFLFPLFYLIT